MAIIDALDEQVLRIVFIFSFAIILWLFTQFFTKGFIVSVTVGTLRGKRLRTLTNIVKTSVSTFIFAIAIFMILREIGVDIAPLIASAGIVGLALGFGAQTLVKDIISGFFLLIEDQFDEGDDVEISGKRGIVERITLRTVWVTGKDGVVHIIPNGSITMVSNFSKKN